MSLGHKSCTVCQGRTRYMWNKDEVKGKAERAKGRIKSATGKLVGNDRLRGEGAADEAVGAAREGAGKGRRKVGEAIEKVGNAIKK
jgi:uncharacterized protein YjbJ (UPF0337 family)